MSLLKKTKVDIESTEEVKEEKPKKKDWFEKEGQLAVDVYQTDDEFCIEAPIAGVEPDAIDVGVENEMLVIKGERKAIEKEVDDPNYYYKECFWGSFSRRLMLPKDLDTSKIKASLKKGILIVKIPKINTNKKKKVSISVEE